MHMKKRTDHSLTWLRYLPEGIPAGVLTPEDTARAELAQGLAQLGSDLRVALDVQADMGESYTIQAAPQGVCLSGAAPACSTARTGYCRRSLQATRYPSGRRSPSIPCA